LSTQNKPALLVRLGHIIVIQVLFVFAALALFIFSPRSDLVVERGFADVEQDLQRIVGGIAWTGAQFENVTQGHWKRSFLDSLMAGMGRYRCLSVYTQDSTGSLAPMYRLRSSGGGSDQSLSPCEEIAVDRTTLRYAMSRPDGAMIPHTLSSGRVIYYYPFRPKPDRPAVLVAASDHSLLISSKSHVRYGLIMLFLCSALVSLLTVYLVWRRFREPLKYLEKGLQKTSEKDLYYQIEPSGEPEIDRIAESFNKISRSLYQGEQKQRQYSELIQDAYLSNLESQAFLATLIDNSPCCIVATSVDGEIVIFNRKSAEVFGYQDDSPIGRQVDELFIQSVAQQSQQAAVQPDESGVEVICRRADGGQFPAFLVLSPIMNGEGQIAAHLFILLDISESRNFQEMMVEVDRYSTRGEMAGDIAHEINNYLAVLSGNIELMPLFLKRGDTEKMSKKLELMKNTVDRIARFTDGLMDVNHGETQFEQTDLNQLIQNLLAFLKPQNRFDGIEFRVELDPELPTVQVDGSQIQQVLVNLVHNAGDALADHEMREITVRTKTVPDSDRSCVLVEVCDSGPGVPEDRIEALFHQRFTTKRKGHGYGLVTCRKIIEAHNGRIGYRHDDHSTFYFEVPVVHEGHPVDEDVVPSASSVHS
jgi:two-component system sensor kinase FixL